MRSLNWRLALVAVGIIMTVVMAKASPADQYIILIEFGTMPSLEGTEVVIDGQVAGTLKKMGPRTQTGFKVGEGDHTVSFNHPEYESETARVSTGFGGQKVMLMPELANRRENGEDHYYLVLYP